MNRIVLLILAAVIFGLGFTAGYWRGALSVDAARTTIDMRSTAPDPANVAVEDADKTAAATDPAAKPESEPDADPSHRSFKLEDLLAYRGHWSDLLHDAIQADGRTTRYRFNPRTFLAALSTSDKQDLLTATLQYPDANVRRSFMFMLARDLGQHDAAAAVATFADASVSDRRDLLTPLLQGMAATDPQAAWDWLNGLRDQPYGAYALEQDLFGPRMSLLSDLVRDTQNIPLALALARSINNPDLAKAMARSIANQVMRNHTDAALDNLTGDTEVDQMIVDGMIRKLADNNPTEAAAWVARNSDLVGPASIKAVADSLAVAQGAAALNALYANFTDPALRDVIAERAALRSVRDDLTAAANWVQLIEDPRARIFAGLSALRELGFEANFDQHLAFAESAYANDLSARRSALGYSLRQFKANHPEDLADYLQQIAKQDPALYPILAAGSGARSPDGG